MPKQPSLRARRLAAEVLSDSSAATNPVDLRAPQLSNRGLARVADSSGASRRPLPVSRPTDPQEREADLIADRVMRSVDPGRAGPASDTATHLVEGAPGRPAMQGPGEHTTLRRSSRDTAEPPRTAPAAADIERGRAGGAALPRSERALFEPRFGHDFGPVRVHRDAHAAGLARRAGARAFTVGHDIFFGAGQYAPGTLYGRHLLAHELTHVVQQGTSNPQPVHRSIVQRSGDASGVTDLLPSGPPTTGSAAGPAADLISFLDLGVNVADVVATAGFASSHAMASISAVSGLAAVGGLVVSSFIALDKAMSAGSRWAAVQGASYGIVSFAHGKPPPTSPPSSKADYAGDFRKAAREAQRPLRERERSIRRLVASADRLSGPSGEAMQAVATHVAASFAGVIAGIQQNPQAALNEIYGALLERETKNTFLWMEWTRTYDNLYYTAGLYELTWPAVGERLK